MQKNWKQRLEEDLHTRVHCGITHKNQERETTQKSTKRGMDKENMEYTYKGILFSFRKGENPGTCYNKDEPWGHYATWKSQSQKGKYCVVLLIYNTRSNQTHRNKNKMVAAKGWGREKWGVVQWVHSFSFARGKSSVYCTIMWIYWYLTLLICTLNG